MAVAELSENRVEERLAALEETYESFPINQTTLSVSASAYERARDRCSEGLVDVYVQVYADDGDVLLVEGDGEWVVPHAQPPVTERLERGARREIAERTGVDCEIDDLDRITILGVRHEDAPDRDPVYRLVTVFSAEYRRGTPGPGAAWRSELPDSALPTY
ncbi:MAG: NUDIX hydrolase [Haloarculaceae archaeon]